MALEDLMKQVAGTFERDGSSVHTVFGDAMKLEHHTIVPVAVVTGGGGAGGAGGAQGEATPFAGGMGLALNVRPVGFIYESGDEVLFTPIHLDVRDRPLWTEAAFGVRRAIDLATSVVAQLMHRPPAKRSAPVVMHPVVDPPGDDASEVTSPS